MCILLRKVDQAEDQITMRPHLEVIKYQDAGFYLLCSNWDDQTSSPDKGDEKLNGKLVAKNFDSITVALCHRNNTAHRNSGISVSFWFAKIQL